MSLTLCVVSELWLRVVVSRYVVPHLRTANKGNSWGRHFVARSAFGVAKGELVGKPSCLFMSCIFVQEVVGNVFKLVLAVSFGFGAWFRVSVTSIELGSISILGC